MPVHTVIVLLRPEAAHRNLEGLVHYAPRPQRGSMDFRYEVVRLWERPADDLLAGDLGVAPLAVLGKLSGEVPLADALANVVQRAISEAPPERGKRLLTDALLLTGLRVKRHLVASIFRGVHVMRESDTYLMIVDEGKEKQAKQAILLFGEERFGPADDTIKTQLESVSDLDRLNRMIRRAAKASGWREVLDTQ